MKWIKVEDRLPPVDVQVLICLLWRDRKGTSTMEVIELGSRVKGGHYWVDSKDERPLEDKQHCVIAWMFLPDTPGVQTKVLEKCPPPCRHEKCGSDLIPVKDQPGIYQCMKCADFAPYPGG